MKKKPQNLCFIGTAGWSLSKQNKVLFPSESSHLASYAQRFRAVEINSSFYRPHKANTYEKWAGSVPKGFRFAVKVPRAITHEKRLKNVEVLTSEFLSGVLHLGEKLGVLLVQCPPSYPFDASLLVEFVSRVRLEYAGSIAFEPRHLSWFNENALRTLEACGVSRVIADPSPIQVGDGPGTSSHFSYFRLHGSPKMYYSCYDRDRLGFFAAQIELELAKGKNVWCIFDNTAEGFAIPNALELKNRVENFCAE